jgi:ribosomal protein L40E
MATSKNNPDARRIEGWRCKKCNTPNPAQSTVCRGKTSTRLLVPNTNGHGMRVTMEHLACNAARTA